MSSDEFEIDLPELVSKINKLSEVLLGNVVKIINHFVPTTINNIDVFTVDFTKLKKSTIVQINFYMERVDERKRRKNKKMQKVQKSNIIIINSDSSNIFEIITSDSSDCQVIENIKR